MKNIKAIISYDGSKFYGSQIQLDKKTIQGEIKKALDRLKINSKIIFSGRTDAKVHAINQVINFYIPDFWEIDKLQIALNNLLNPEILIKKLFVVDINFHARFSAKSRVYRYIVSTKPTNPFNANYTLYIPNLDINQMQKGIKLFIGEHDFRYFKKNGSDERNSICNIKKAYIYQYKEYIIFYFEANRFLRSQIRLMVGFLIQIGQYKLTISSLQKQLLAQKLIYHKPIKPNGLYLSKIKY